MNTFVSYQLWSPEECDEIIERTRKTPCHPALSVVDDRNQIKKSFRQADMYGLGDRRLLDQILDAAKQVNLEQWGFEIDGGLPSVEVLRYEKGGHQASHTDWGGVHRNRKITFTIQLSPPDAYEGGELVLFDGPEPWLCDVSQGSITLFPSWTLHQVNELTFGERWSAVGWVLGNSSYA